MKQSPGWSSETLEKELFPFQAKEQNDGYDQGQNHEDGRDEPIGNPSEEGVLSRSKHLSITQTDAARVFYSPLPNTP